MALETTETAASPGGGRSASRSFWFARGTSYGDALRAIRAGLDDEGLTLSNANTPDRVRSFLTADGLRFVVPGARVLNRPWPRDATMGPVTPDGGEG